MTLNIAVVDDIETDSRRICNYIEQYFSKCRNITIHVSAYSSAGKFLAEYLKGVFQIVFLDIRMEEINGLELANRLRIADRDTSIVFMSSVRDYVFDTFSVKPDGYLCKPVEYAAFTETMDMIIARSSRPECTITLKLPRNEMTVRLSEIVSVVACNHVSEFRLITGETYASRTLFKELESVFEKEPNFLLCNRGVFVNMDYAVRETEGKIVLQNGDEYPIRRRDSKAITSKFTTYTAQRLRRELTL